MSREDASHGSNGRQGRAVLFVEVSMDGIGAELAKIAAKLPMASSVQDEGFDLGRSATGSSGPGGTIGEIDTV